MGWLYTRSSLANDSAVEQNRHRSRLEKNPQCVGKNSQLSVPYKELRRHYRFYAALQILFSIQDYRQHQELYATESDLLHANSHHAA